MSNPLLNITDLIDFPAIKPEHVVDGMKALIADAESTLKTVTAQETPATWDDVITPLENKTLALSRAWGAVSHLMSVCDSPALREAYNQALPLVTQFWIGLSQSTLSDKYLAIKESPKFSDLSATRQRIINEELVEFKLAGAFLNDEGKAKLKAVKEALAKESQKFSENLMDATNAYGLIVENKKDLAGIPEDDIASFKEAAEGKYQVPGASVLPHRISVTGLYRRMGRYTDRLCICRICQWRWYPLYYVRGFSEGRKSCGNHGYASDLSSPVSGTVYISCADVHCDSCFWKYSFPPAILLCDCIVHIVCAVLITDQERENGVKVRFSGKQRSGVWKYVWITTDYRGV